MRSPDTVGMNYKFLKHKNKHASLGFFSILNEINGDSAYIKYRDSFVASAYEDMKHLAVHLSNADITDGGAGVDIAKTSGWANKLIYNSADAILIKSVREPDYKANLGLTLLSDLQTTVLGCVFDNADPIPEAIEEKLFKERIVHLSNETDDIRRREFLSNEGDTLKLLSEGIKEEYGGEIGYKPVKDGKLFWFEMPIYYLR
jgi:hypothetical protein